MLKLVKQYPGCCIEINATYAEEHYYYIKNFGRYPYRNAVHLEKSTPEEIEFLKKQKVTKCIRQQPSSTTKAVSVTGLWLLFHDGS